MDPVMKETATDELDSRSKFSPNPSPDSDKD